MNIDLSHIDLPKYLLFGLIAYLLYTSLSGHSMLEGMVPLGPWGYPIHSYPGYYNDLRNDIQGFAGKCVNSGLKTDCVNKKLYETKGDMEASIASCKSPQALVSLQAQRRDRELNHPDFPKYMYTMPTTVPTVDQRVPSYYYGDPRRERGYY